MSLDDGNPSDATDGYSISPRLSGRRVSPRSPLNLSDLNSSSASESSSITEIVAAKQDLQAKYDAAVQTRRQYKDREVDLEGEIRELNKKADVTLQILEDRKERLTEENDRLQEELDNLPPLDYLEEQLQMLQAADQEERVIEREEVEELDVDQLIRIGVLQRGETLVVLPKRIADMISELRRYESGTHNEVERSQTEVSRREELELRKRIASLQKVHRFMSEQAAKEIQALTMEVERLRKVVADLEARGSTSSSRLSSRPYRSPKTSLYLGQSGERKTSRQLQASDRSSRQRDDISRGTKRSLFL